MKRKKPMAKGKRRGWNSTLRPVNPKTKGHRKRVGDNPEYRAWIATLPCVLLGHEFWHFCWGPVDCCHIRTRGAGHPDRGNCFPACRAAHSIQHSLGIKSFQATYELDLPALAARLADARRALEEISAKECQYEGRRSPMNRCAEYAPTFPDMWCGACLARKALSGREAP